MKYILVLLLASLVLAQRQVIGQAITITGLDSEMPRTQVQSAKLEQNKMVLGTGLGQIAIQGFPTWLGTQKLVGSTLSTVFNFRPDGPESRLEFAQNNRAFLMLGSSTRPNAILLGQWRFAAQTKEQTVFIKNLERTIALPLEQSVVVKHGLLLWCVRLAALHLPVPNQAGIANEAGAPRFDWAALRVAKATQCQN